MIHATIRELFHKHAVGLWIFDFNQDTKVNKVVKPMAMEWETCPNEWHMPEPSLELPMFAAFEYLRAIQDALSRSDWFQVKATNDDADNKAIKEHIGDLREMNKRLIGLLESKL